MAVTGRQVWGWLNLTLAALLALGAWGLISLLFARPSLRQLWDVSPQARFSVEPATEDLLAQIRDSDEPIEFHTVYLPIRSMQVGGPEGKQYRALYQALQQNTTDLLRTYDFLGGDAVTVTHHDLMRDVDAIRAVMQQIQNRNYNVVVIRRGSRSKVLHLVNDLADLELPDASAPVPGGQQAVPRLRDYKGEEAISTALKQLLVEGTPKIYFLAGNHVSLTDGIADSYSEMVGALADDGFEVASLSLAQEGRIPDDATVVAILEPRAELTDAEAELLIAFMRRGGRVFLNLAYSFVGPSWNPTMRALGERLGFEIGRELVCHIVEDPRNPGAEMGGDYAVNLNLTDLNPVHPVTRVLLQNQRFPVVKGGREIRKVDGGEDGVRVDTSFLRTGPKAWIDPRATRVPPRQREAYASRCIGAVIDVDPTEGERPGHCVLLSGAAFVNTGFSVNGDLALNLFNWLARRDALVSVRGNRYVSRALELKPQQLERMYQLLVFGVPGALLLLGVAVAWRRRRA